MSLIDLLKLPDTKGSGNLDDPAVTVMHREILRRKPFMKRLYQDFYRQFADAVDPARDKMLVELGSGGGFLKEVIPGVVTSDVLVLPGVDKVFSALSMPFENGSVDAFFMLNVFHHVLRPQDFLAEAARCLRKGGRLVMIEPANTRWARFVYRNFHHERFEPEAGWTSEEGGPLSGGNDALAWIVFVRDRSIFEQQFPVLRILHLRNHTPVSYLLSGGFTLKQLAPGWTYAAVRGLEYLLSPFRDWLGMFMTIELQKTAL